MKNTLFQNFGHIILKRRKYENRYAALDTHTHTYDSVRETQETGSIWSSAFRRRIYLEEPANGDLANLTKCLKRGCASQRSTAVSVRNSVEF